MELEKYNSCAGLSSLVVAAIIMTITEDNNNNEPDTSCCASCGTAEVDDIALKKCTACYLVRYCGVKCQREHRPQHKRACKKRAAELRDELLFKQPESTHHGDCPICLLPLPLDLDCYTMRSCCSKIICDGCSVAFTMQQMQQMLDEKCPFCRKPVPTEEENIRYRMKRIEANDPIAMCQEGTRSYAKGDYSSAFEYFSKAAKLGDADAHSYLALMYHDGHGVEKDEKKEIYHYEEAAIGGHPSARFNLALIDRKRYGRDRATKHHIIAAGQGHDGSLTWLLENHRRGGFVKKEVLGAALRAHQAAVDATKSPQREEAKKVFITD